ncbi:MAG: DUF4194 domain-containing protein [Planctomycetota bacterium]
MPQLDQGLPEFKEWSIAAVRLLQGVVYSDDGPVWNLLLTNQSRIEEYLGRLGVILIVDQDEGFAFLRQAEVAESPPEYERLPKLFRKTTLSFSKTLLMVLLRDKLRRFDEEELHHDCCVVSTTELFELWKPFFPANPDETRLYKSLREAVATLEEMKFIRLFGKEPEEWEVRRILKARLPAETLEALLIQLQSESERRTGLAANED